MSKAKQLRRKQAKTEIAKGKRSYFLRHGVIGWSLPMYLVFLGVNLAIQKLLGKSLAEALRLLVPFPLIAGLIIFGIAGIFVANSRWKQLLQQAGKLPKAPKTVKTK